MKPTVRIGTRGSQLALYQAELVKVLLEREFRMVTVEVIKIKTSGDMIRRGGTSPLETKRIYTREIEDALLKDEVDIAVHSAKDMAAVLPEGLKIGAVLEREDSRDCLVSRDHKKLVELGIGARIGTSSLRRRQQLLRLHSELIVEEVHGNVDTRVRKIDEGDYDAMVLAHAGIIRLGLGHLVAEIFAEERFYPAPGQGIIALQARLHDPDLDEMLVPLNHKHSAQRLDCERAFLRRLEGGCQLPCGIRTSIEDHKIRAAGALFAIEGHEMAEASHTGDASAAAQTGTELAEKILDAGGAKILKSIRKGNRT